MGVEPFLVGSSNRLHRSLSGSPDAFCQKVQGVLQAPSTPRLGRRQVGFRNPGGNGCGLPPVTATRAAAPAVATGYFGRFAIHEVLQVSEEIERTIVERGHTGRQSARLPSARGC